MSQCWVIGWPLQIFLSLPKALLCNPRWSYVSTFISWLNRLLVAMHLPGGRWFAFQFFWNVMDFWQECTKMSWSEPNYNDLSFAELRLENLVPEMKMRQWQWKFMNQCLSLNGQGVDDDERDWSLSVPLGIFLSQCVSISGQCCCSSSWWWWRWWWWWWCWRKITWEHTILFSGNIKYRSQTIQKHLSFLIWNYLDCDSCDWRDTLAGLKRNLKNCWKYRWPRLKLKYCSAHGVNLRPERAVHESWVHRQSTLHHPQLPSPPWFSVLVYIFLSCHVTILSSSSDSISRYKEGVRLLDSGSGRSPSQW